MKSTDTHLIPAALQQGNYQNSILVGGVEISWDISKGQCSFRGLPVAMMWVDTTLAGVMSGVASMVGPERFNLALQAEGRKSVESDWLLITQYPDFKDGFAALNLNAAVAGCGDWQLIDYQPAQKFCLFRAYNNWEGLYQRELGVCWGSGMLAGKLSGICSKLFNTNCWATQTQFVATGADYDEFAVMPSSRLLENEIEKLLLSDKATRADMAVAMKKLHEREHSLKRANADLQRFAEVSAHHLMEPTRRLGSYSQRLRQQIASVELSLEQREYINETLAYLHRDAQLLYNRIHDVQLYLMATENSGEVYSANPALVLNNLRLQWATKLTEANAELSFSHLPAVHLDLARLQQLFNLLIDNCLKHAHAERCQRNLHIHISGERLGKVSRFKVTDNGVGIAQTYHERVFTIFERLSHHNDTATGIGLSIARRIVESCHGKIWLENNPSAGISVIFELPDRHTL